MRTKVCTGLLLVSLLSLTACGAARKNPPPEEAALPPVNYGGKLIVKEAAFLHCQISELLAANCNPTSVLSVLPVNRPIYSEFGMRQISGRQARFHKGVDISAPKGTPVNASGPGEVIFTGRRNGYGKVVEIDHGNGVVTLYAHLDKMQVEKGQPVKAGDQIGTVGRTGRTTGANLHFEVRLNYEPIDPAGVLHWS